MKSRTESPQTPAEGETPEQIARRFVVESGLKIYGKRRQMLEDQVLFALRNERDRAAKISESHKHISACDGAGCKIVIAAAIREGR